MAEEAPPAQSCRLFAGQRLGAGGEPLAELHWVLALTTGAVGAQPSAFGAAWAAGGSGGGGAAALVGKWDPTIKALVLTEKGEAATRYEGKVSQGPQGLVVKGTWQRAGEQGAFALCSEDEGERLLAGLWLGEAKPDPGLEPFQIPTNPIRWALSLQQGGPCFGCGYFDDAADVRGQPVLFFLLTGSWAAEGGAVTITKAYEAVASGETDGVVVVYDGALELGGDGAQLAGTWRNESGGSFGSFLCRREPAAAQ